MSKCAKCNEALVLEVEDEGSDDDEVAGTSMTEATKTIPDDVHLPCNCHFHWQCLLDSYDLDTCPQCSTSIISVPAGRSSTSNPRQQILVNLNNEGGAQQRVDIFPILKEESYLRAYPEERKCRAFLEFCREGDHRAVVDLLHGSGPSDDEDEDEDGGEGIVVDEMVDAPPTGALSKSPDEILRYQDPIGDMQSGLHAAVANGHREVAWLLLLLASELPMSEFPALVFQEAATLGVMRGDQSGKDDLRSLKDAHGRTAEDVAKESGVVWTGWIGNGRLALP